MYKLICGLVAMFVLAGCGSKLAHGYRSVLVVCQARDSMSKAMSTYCKPIHDDCVLKHGINTDRYKQCIERCEKMLGAWKLIVLPVIESALHATMAVLETAYKAKDKKAPWLEKLKPGVCALFKLAKEWKQYLGVELEKILITLDFVEKITCTY
jgi:hypothetical protein